MGTRWHLVRCEARELTLTCVDEARFNFVAQQSSDSGRADCVRDAAAEDAAVHVYKSSRFGRVPATTRRSRPCGCPAHSLEFAVVEVEEEEAEGEHDAEAADAADGEEGGRVDVLLRERNTETEALIFSSRYACGSTQWQVSSVFP